MVWRFSSGLDRALRSPRPALQALRIDLNRAPPAELRLLPGFGPARARAVVLERVRGGPFRELGDLQRVPGIGPVTLEAIEPWVRVEMTR